VTTDQFSQPTPNGAFLLGEEPDNRSREFGEVTGSMGYYYSGTVLGRLPDGRWTALNPAASDGSEIAAGLLWGRVSISAGDVVATIITRRASANGLDLAWPAGITVGQKATAIAQLGACSIQVRT
jgi:Bacteriophage lambda head decoration protein D